MRITPTTLARAARRTLAATVVAGAVGSTAILTAGTAAASSGATVTADNCTATVGGRVGDTVSLSGEAVSELVRQGAEEARTIVVVHHITIWPNHLARKVSDAELEVGTVADARSGSISGEDIASAVRQELDGKAGLGALPSTQETTLDTIGAKVAETCGLTVEATNPSEPSRTKPSEPSSGPEGSVGGDGSTGTERTGSSAERGFQNTGDTHATRRDYGGIPVAEAPGAGISVPDDLQYAPSSGIPGEADAPLYGVLDKDNEGAGNSAQGSADVRDAGNADTLAAPERQQTVQLPMVLAVAALAVVTAGLVRTWVLRRVS